VNILEDAHKLSSLHRGAIQASKVCGCFYCLSTFNPEFIKEWTDSNRTALCPKCGIDSVLPESDMYILDFEFLHQMYEVWFARK
jgi:hypothetical protein